MQIIKKNLKQGEVTVKANNPEDLWYLSQVINADDIVSGKTGRKIKLGGEDERQRKVVIKTVFLSLKVEKTEFKKDSDVLRVSGTILEGPDDIPKGNYHTFNVEPGSPHCIFTIKKNEWAGYQLDKLKEAEQQIKRRILVLLFNREEALFALLKNEGHEIILRLKGDVAKKAIEEEKGKNFYAALNKQLVDYNERLKLDSIIIASPGFWKEYLVKELSDEIKTKTVVASCSDVDESNIREVMQKPEVSKVLSEERESIEVNFIESLLKAISKDEACYGLDECKEKINIGAVKELFVSYEFLQEAREKNTHKEIEKMMKLAEQTKAKIYILSSNEPEKKLKGLGGIAGILRWKQ